MGKIERFEIEINGVKHLMTEEQFGNLEIEYSSKEELDAVRLILARGSELPEPELFQDKQIGITPDEDQEKKLNAVIDIQERMTSGMKLIQEAKEQQKLLQEQLDKAITGAFLPRDQFVKLVNGKKAWKIRESQYWNCWWDLKAECDQIVGSDTFLWGMYFGLGREEITTYFTSGDTSEVDEQQILRQDQNEIADDLASAHVQEQLLLIAE